MKKRFLIFLSTILLFNQCQQDLNLESRQEMMAFANEQLGAAYDRTNTKGYDCSGFVQKCYRKVNIKVPRSSEKQAKLGTKIPLKNARLGDVLVFTGSNSWKRKAGHTALLSRISKDTIFFIHSSTSNGVMVNNLLEPYYSSRFLGCRRYFD